MRLFSFAEGYILDYIKFFGSLVEKVEDTSTISMIVYYTYYYYIEIDLFSIPENAGFCFFLYALIHTAQLTSNDFLWLKGTLSIKLNLKYSRIQQFLQKEIYPPISDYELRGYILRIPLVSIQNWYQKQGQFSDPSVMEILSHFRCEFGLNNGMTKEVFKQIRELEIVGHQEIRDLAIPCNRSERDFGASSISLPTPQISEVDIEQLNAKLREIDF